VSAEVDSVHTRGPNGSKRLGIDVGFGLGDQFTLRRITEELESGGGSSSR
jgi:hypothetical protein